MTIADLGSLGELVSSIAVVISLIYLAIQIRSQTLESRLAATRELASKRADALKQLMADDTLMEVWIKAIRDYDSLQGVERLRASVIFNLLMRNAEQEFIHKGTGHADDPYLESVDRVLMQYVSGQGLRQWWATTGNLFSSKFQRHVEDLIQQAADNGLNDVFAIAPGSQSEA